ncbi:sel1 repeat family protein [Lysobacter silvisoli]|uniref:sel1 repeat family protein n=1 Tax=Lysobacter silvisoli TaxID=2293254 RepID=UPI0011C064F7|nr:sel1 repeat family protein [Lysobacter silvisoli]
MRGWMLCLALLAAPAAADELTEMNAVSQTWDRYTRLSSRDDPATADLLSAAALRRMAFLRDAALYASPEQVRRIPMSERSLVMALRASLSDDKLLAMDGAGMARHLFAQGLYGLSEPEDGEPLPRLSHVTLIDAERAIGEMAPPNGQQFQYGPEFKREGGRWKVSPESIAADESSAIEQQMRSSGMGEDVVLPSMVRLLLGENAPELPLATLERPLRDDAAARTRLNEEWPDYEDPIRVRLLATQRKAEDGDPLAAMGLGALLYTGQLPALMPQDKARGIKLLEQSSDAGNAQGAWMAYLALGETEQPAKGQVAKPELLERMARHARRAAEGGVAEAMISTASFTFDGVGGPRDCKLAEEWAARGEDAGAKNARNERVWYLAVCPIPAQRDPKRALELAAYMIARADTLEFSELDTIAAALAANARYSEAGTYQQRAIDKFDGDRNGDTLRRMKGRLADYRSGKDWVQSYKAAELPVE